MSSEVPWVCIEGFSQPCPRRRGETPHAPLAACLAGSALYGHRVDKLVVHKHLRAQPVLGAETTGLCILVCVISHAEPKHAEEKAPGSGLSHLF